MSLSGNEDSCAGLSMMRQTPDGANSFSAEKEVLWNVMSGAVRRVGPCFKSISAPPANIHKRTCSLVLTYDKVSRYIDRSGNTARI